MARRDYLSLELSPARAARGCRAAHRLPWLDGYDEKFTLDITGDPLAGPADDINDAADKAIKQFAFIDGTRQAAGGASYGGHLTNWLAGTTTRYRCLVSHAGLATLEMQWGISDGIYHREVMMGGPYWENPAKWIAQSPLAKAGNFKTPTLLGRIERLPRAGRQHADDVIPRCSG